ncbi:MAG: orotidine 5'-phosphate decarboxylase [Acidobacteria bacterium]|nr:orotidine 5'-phosphate decarboxylase [Acidobacteriota bacterium]
MLKIPSHGIICACDLDNLDAVRRLLEEVDSIEGLVGYKLGSLLALRYGLAAAVRAMREMTAKLLLYDHQKAGLDVPSMAAEYVKVCRDSGVDALILFPLAGPSAVDAFVSETLKAGLVPVVGGALPLKDYLARKGGYVMGTALTRIAERAFDLGARDFIIPATDARAIRRHVRRFAGRGARLFMPGIGPLGGDITNAFTAARGMSAYAIIGRAIYADSKPADVARSLAREAMSFVDQQEWVQFT